MQRKLIVPLAVLVMAVVGVGGCASSGTAQEGIDVIEQQPLVAMGDVPLSVPTLAISSSMIPAYSLDWSTSEGHESIVSDGERPKDEVEIGSDRVSFRISAPERPLSLTVLVFSGTVESVDPTSDPVEQFDCLESETACELSDTETGMEFSIDASGLPEDFVVSIFVEYYKASELPTEDGSTNTVGWVAGIRRQ
ncbi:hypothetical protein [Leucobacter luti]|uniref:hypothetical protein n=1 Tax=Leucobacter luti TaxID=340320 RepID=UPI001C69002A|nr:hypothetical protein [Leucobacter luti]QYM74690.1 hypothetical protein K1X41_07930 [Leucobacter luti]